MRWFLFVYIVLSLVVVGGLYAAWSGSAAR
jgi:hypothetical protein